MLILILVIILLVIGIVFQIIDRDDGIIGMWGMGITIVAGFTLFIAILLLLAGPFSTRGDIQEYYATQQTLNNMRADGTDLEDAAIQQKVLEMNQWLARKQWYNKKFFIKDMIPDEIDELEPLR